MPALCLRLYVIKATGAGDPARGWPHPRVAAAAARWRTGWARSSRRRRRRNGVEPTERSRVAQELAIAARLRRRWSGDAWTQWWVRAR